MDIGQFSPKHLVNMGVFTAIYVVVMFTLGMVGVLGAPFMFVGWTICILVNGVVMMLYLSRTPVMGALTVVGLIVGIIYLLTGSVWWVLLIVPILGFIGDLVNRAGQFKSKKHFILAYGVFTMWYLSPLLPIFYDSDNYFREIAKYMKSQEYADQMQAIFQPWVIGVWGVVLFFIGVLGAYIGTRILNKHFVKAGIA